MRSGVQPRPRPPREGEGRDVVACVARAEGPCDDRAWARCAARVGPHADGGPPGAASPEGLRSRMTTMSVRTRTDDHGRVLEFSTAPRRVVSLVPSDTLNVAALGCAEALVGRTDYCELPDRRRAARPARGRDEEPARRRHRRARAGPRHREPGGEHQGRPRGARAARGPGVRRLPEARGAGARAPRAARARLRRPGRRRA